MYYNQYFLIFNFSTIIFAICKLKKFLSVINNIDNKNESVLLIKTLEISFKNCINEFIFNKFQSDFLKYIEYFFLFQNSVFFFPFNEVIERKFRIYLTKKSNLQINKKSEKKCISIDFDRICSIICKHTTFLAVSHPRKKIKEGGEKKRYLPQAFIAAHLARQRA